MSKKNVVLLAFGCVLVLLAAAVTVWAVTDLPGLIPKPKATVSDEPYAGNADGCDGLYISINPDSVTPTAATLVIRNETGYDFLNDTFSIQKRQDGQWYHVNFLESFHGFAAMGTRYPAEEAHHTVEISWEHAVGRLEAGHYRLLWQVYSEPLLIAAEQGLRDYSSAVLSAEFDVK